MMNSSRSHQAALEFKEVMAACKRCSRSARSLVDEGTRKRRDICHHWGKPMMSNDPTQQILENV